MKWVRGCYPWQNFGILYRKWCILEHFLLQKIHYKNTCAETLKYRKIQEIDKNIGNYRKYRISRQTAIYVEILELTEQVITSFFWLLSKSYHLLRHGSSYTADHSDHLPFPILVLFYSLKPRLQSDCCKRSMTWMCAVNMDRPSSSMQHQPELSHALPTGSPGPGLLVLPTGPETGDPVPAVTATHLKSNYYILMT